ncbi:MAG TPA: M23 family metallopeptidase [Pyrinomonadaceae bacterium]|jgi:murein DD-endopeptidase MepM/ murein hydrolase activator NlpD
MIKYSCPPAPGSVNLRPLSTLLAFGIALLCLTAVSVSAQTRAKRADGNREEERARRVHSESQAETDDFDEAEMVPQNPQVRKTALTYSNASQPALTNDIVIISRAPAASASRAALAPKAGAGASASIPSIWPVVGPLRSGVGTRKNPFGGSSIEFHKGQDISAPMGTPIIAAADGVVVIARRMRGYGNGIYIDHGNGIQTRYGHLSRIDVVEGQPIKKGQHLGLVGSTGRSTGPHLHYEVRINGEPTSPLLYLPALETAAPPVPALPAAKGN